jgi:NTE family protein
MALASTMDGPNVQAWRNRYEEVRTWNGRDLAFVPTVFDRLERRLCRQLIYRGWWLTGAALAKYHPGSFALPPNAPPLA